MSAVTWTPAEPTTPYTDEWPPGTWTAAVQDAYKRLEDAGGIAIDRIRIAPRTHYVIVLYRGAYPQPWAHEILGRFRREYESVMDGQEVTCDAQQRR